MKRDRRNKLMPLLSEFVFLESYLFFSITDAVSS
jgi:hypothetical protein